MLKLQNSLNLTYEYKDNYMVDISNNGETLDVFIWKRGYGDKMHIFGVPAKNVVYSDFLQIVEENLNNCNYLDIYKDTFED